MDRPPLFPFCQTTNFAYPGQAQPFSHKPVPLESYKFPKPRNIFSGVSTNYGHANSQKDMLVHLDILPVDTPMPYFARLSTAPQKCTLSAKYLPRPVHSGYQNHIFLKNLWSRQHDFATACPFRPRFYFIVTFSSSQRCPKFLFCLLHFEICSHFVDQDVSHFSSIFPAI